ncbi:O-antigen ligase family protein [bacterium]|nr:O-antigen ligase family protein [bacterium]
MANFLSDTFFNSNSKVFSVLAAFVIIISALGISQLVGANESLAIYLLAGVVIFLFAFVNTDFALSMLILSMLLSPEFGSGSGAAEGSMAAQRDVVIRVDDVLLGIITLSWLAKTALNKDIGIFIKTPLNKPIFAYILASLFSTILGIFTNDVKPLVGILYNVKYFQYFMIYFMVSSHIRNIKTFNRYITLLLVTAFIVSVYAIIQIPSGVRVSAPFEGKAGEANTLGGYLIIIMFIVIGIMTGTKKINAMVGLGAFLLLMMLPFAYTLSRSSWISFFPSILVMIAFSPKRKYIIAVLAVTVLASPAFIPEAVIERVEYTFSDENTLRTDVVDLGDTSLDPSTSLRIQSWTSTLEQWTKRPIFGYGVTGAGFKDAQYFRVLVETGVVGFSLFAWVLASVFVNARKSLKKINEKRFPQYYGIVAGFIASFFGLLTHAVGANTFIIVRVMEPFWFLTAMVIVLPGFLEEEEIDQDINSIERFIKQQQKAEFSSYGGKL